MLFKQSNFFSTFFPGGYRKKVCPCSFWAVNKRSGRNYRGPIRFILLISCRNWLRLSKSAIGELISRTPVIPFAINRGKKREQILDAMYAHVYPINQVLKICKKHLLCLHFLELEYFSFTNRCYAVAGNQNS